MSFDAAFSKWKGREDEKLARSDKGQILSTLGNVLLILSNDHAWKDVIATNEMSGEVVKRALPPFPHQAALGEWTDMDYLRTKHWLEEHYGVRQLRENDLVGGVELAGDANRFHEVREYLNALKWDGNPRLQYWLSAYLGVEETEYSTLVGIKWMVGAVARIMKRPCKMDNVLILEGHQGAGKSTVLRVLFDPWFTDAAFEIGSTDGNQIIRGMWGVELAELDSFNRAETSKSKAFFSRQDDRYRAPYGRKPVTVVRQCVFAGSVNHFGGYFRDETGNRRYWPVRCGQIGLDELRTDRDQLWAEAMHAFKKGTEWWVRASELSLFEEAQESRQIGDAFEDKIVAWLEGRASGDAEGKKHRVTVADVLAKGLHLDTSKWSSLEQQRVGRIMSKLGWTRKRDEKPNEDGKRGWGYVRPGGGE